LSSLNLMSVNLENAEMSWANLAWTNLVGARLMGANLADAYLGGANLTGANLEGAVLDRAKLKAAILRDTNLKSAKLNHAYMYRVELRDSDLTNAELRGATLVEASIVRTHFENANLSECSVYGISAWDVYLEGAIQSNLIITPEEQPKIQVDDLRVAQFMYLLLNNQSVRQAIDTITSKTVLILGRFTPEREVILEAIRNGLRKRGRVPMLFDFDKPRSQTTDETISTLAHLSRFVVADLTDAKSVLQELRAIVPNSPNVPVQPLLLASQEEPGMFDFFRKFPWVLEPLRYTDQATLIAELEAKVIAPGEARALLVQS